VLPDKDVELAKRVWKKRSQIIKNNYPNYKPSVQNAILPFNILTDEIQEVTDEKE